MTRTPQLGEVRMIPLDRIEVLNTRERNQAVFDDIVENIKRIGLKKPVTVTRRSGVDGAEAYVLICGEGRLKAFRLLGETRIPALVVDATEEDAYIMSLAENIARRKYRPLELLHGIKLLHEKGYEAQAIAKKTGLTTEYVQSLVVLLDQGEERLLAAVERGAISINAARAIVGAGDDDKALQIALQNAYESGELRGKQLLEARRLIERRQMLGRSIGKNTPRRRSSVTTASLVRTYQQEVERQQMIVRKGSLTQQRLLFVVGALRRLIDDENFVTLLRAEGLDSMPKNLGDRIHRGSSR